MTLQQIKPIEAELKRFQEKLKAAKKKIEESGDTLYTGTRETGALRRAALDLKDVLTKNLSK